MAPNITYDGVEGAAGGGTIFEDVKFWVATRIPMRPSILGLIKNNGGVVVPLEKNADMLIADHVRKNDVPAGSYSWKFITDSVENGVIQLQDRYRIGPDPNVPKQAGTGGLHKSGRTPFTTEDDSVLAKYVLSHLTVRTGNSIYMEFEKMNPRHTWQSWRNRWNKKLSNLSEQQLDQMVQMAENKPPQPAEESPPSLVHPKTNAIAQKKAKQAGADHEFNGNAAVQRSAATMPNQAAAQDTGRAKKQTDKKAEKRVTPPAAAAVAAVPVVVENDGSGRRRRHASSREDDSEGSITSESMRNQFYKDLDDFMLANNLSFAKKQRIGSDRIELWDLGKVVGAQNVPPEEVDWIKVADDLGYSWEDGQKIHGDLQTCYENYLMEFLEAMLSFAAGSGDEEQDEAVGETDAEIEEARSPPDHFPSSPPKEISSRKRKSDSLQLSSSAPMQKRQRGNTRMEIPSTPDRESNTIERRAAGIGPSPSLGQSVERPGRGAREADASQQLPMLLDDGEDEDEDEEEEEEEEEEEALKYPRRTTAAGSKAQPREKLRTQQSSFEASPSQQLQSEQSEWLNSSPISLHLEKERTGRDFTRVRPSNPVQATEQGRSNVRTASGPIPTTPTQPPLLTKSVRRSLPAWFESSGTRKTPKQLETLSAQRRKAAAAEHQRQQEQSREPEENDHQQQIIQWIEHYESLGYSHRIVVNAMKRTTMTPGGLTSLVMQSLKEGNGVPPNYEGIWTDRDDNSLRLVDSVGPVKRTSTAQEIKHRNKAKKEWDRLINKHGLDRVELRRRFLEAEAQAETKSERTRREAEAAKE